MPSLAVARTDIFSLGVMLYEMIAGRAPFAEATTSDVIAAILKDEPPLLAEHAPETPPELHHIVSRALRKDRGERYQTASDLLADLKGLQRGLEFASEEKKRSGRAKAEGEEKFIVPPAGGITNRRRQVVLGAFAFLLIALVGVGLWLSFRPEKSAELTQLEFKGNFYLGMWTEDEIKKGIEYYNQAIALDPSSISAYEGLARGWNLLSDLHLSPREAMPKAKAAALNALQRDETSAHAHVSLGLIKMQYEWDWAGAEREFKRAIALDPENNSAHQLYGWYLIAAGRFDEAQAEMKRALGSDLLNAFGLWGLGDSFYFTRQYEQAIEQYRRAIGVEPKLYWSHLMLGCAYEQQGKSPEAIAELNRALRLNDSPQVLASLGHAYAKSGQRDETQKVIADLQEIGKRRYVSPYDLATIYAGLGEKERTLAWLERAYEDRSGWLALWLKVDPKFDLLRSDPRFRDLLRRIGQAN
jgi:tetratricopeptide (TPR) repeat protein